MIECSKCIREVKKMDTNGLYFGDSLEIIRKNIPNESVDLIS
jgi:DNA modification methylase